MSKKFVSFSQKKIGVTPFVAARVTPTLVTPLSTTPWRGSRTKHSP